MFHKWIATLPLLPLSSRLLLELFFLGRHRSWTCLSPDLIATSSSCSSCDWLIQKVFFPLCHFQLKYYHPVLQLLECVLVLLTSPCWLCIASLAFLTHSRAFDAKRILCWSSQSPLMLMTLLHGCLSFSSLSSVWNGEYKLHTCFDKDFYCFFFFFPPSSSLSPKDKELCPRILKQNMTYLNQNTSEHQALILFWSSQILQGLLKEKILPEREWFFNFSRIIWTVAS